MFCFRYFICIILLLSFLKTFCMDNEGNKNDEIKIDIKKSKKKKKNIRKEENIEMKDKSDTWVIDIEALGCLEGQDEDYSQTLKKRFVDAEIQRDIFSALKCVSEALIVSQSKAQQNIQGTVSKESNKQFWKQLILLVITGGILIGSQYLSSYTACKT